MTPPRNKPKVQHPSYSDIAYKLAEKTRPPLDKVTISDANAKGTVQLTVEVNDPDIEAAGIRAERVFNTLRAELDGRYPREGAK